MADATAIQKLVATLNYEWYKKKKEYYLKEGLYDSNTLKIYSEISKTDIVQVGDDEWEEEESIIVIDVDFITYCYYSFFYGSLTYNIDPNNIPSDFPIDSSEIAASIINLINIHTEKFTDVTAINAIILKVTHAIKQEVNKLKKSVSDQSYEKVLDDFLLKTKVKISVEFNHIEKQIILRKEISSIDRKLTPEICSRIAEFKLGGRSFITSIEGPHTAGKALYNLLTPNEEIISGVKIRVEDWYNKDVYYLLIRLSDIVSGRFSISEIERKKSLYLKNGKRFSRNTFDSFKSQKLETYSEVSTNKQAIDKQLTELF